MNLTFSPQSRIVIFGTTGGGKSNFTKYLIHQLGAYIILDYIHDYDDSWGLIVREPIQILKAVKLGYNKIILQYPKTPPDSVIDKFFDFVFDYLPNTTIICEETDRYAGSRSSENSPFMTFLNLGRHHNNGWICISRRLGRLNLDVISYAQYIVSFFQHTDNDIKRLSKYMGDVANKLKSLQEHHFILWNVTVQSLKQGEKWDLFAPVPLME